GKDKSRFHCGHDERHCFVAGIPESAPVGTMRQAMAARKPAEVMSALLLAGEDSKVVAERLGHSTTRLTQDTYQHVLPGMQERAAGKLDALLRAQDRGQEGAGRVTLRLATEWLQSGSKRRRATKEKCHKLLSLWHFRGGRGGGRPGDLSFFIPPLYQRSSLPPLTTPLNLGAPPRGATPPPPRRPHSPRTSRRACWACSGVQRG